MTEIIFGNSRQDGLYPPCLPAGYTLVSGSSSRRMGLPAENRFWRPNLSMRIGRKAQSPFHPKPREMEVGKKRSISALPLYRNARAVSSSLPEA
jgi:hypothetical protein